MLSNNQRDAFFFSTGYWMAYRMYFHRGSGHVPNQCQKMSKVFKSIPNVPFQPMLLRAFAFWGDSWLFICTCFAYSGLQPESHLIRDLTTYLLCILLRAECSVSPFSFCRVHVLAFLAMSTRAAGFTLGSFLFTTVHLGLASTSCSDATLPESCDLSARSLLQRNVEFKSLSASACRKLFQHFFATFCWCSLGSSVWGVLGCFLKNRTKESYKVFTEGIKEKNSDRNNARVQSTKMLVDLACCDITQFSAISTSQTKSGVRIAVILCFWWQGQRIIWLAQGAFLAIPVSRTRILRELSLDRSWMMFGKRESFI